MRSNEQLHTRKLLLSGAPDPFSGVTLPLPELYHVVGDMETTARRIINAQTALTLRTSPLSLKKLKAPTALTPQESRVIIELLVEHAHTMYVGNERSPQSIKASQYSRTALRNAFAHQGVRLDDESLDTMALTFVHEYTKEK